ncbi:MAG: T9SS type A sorting domain-containing protein [Bacteroidota bacterium]
MKLLYQRSFTLFLLLTMVSWLPLTAQTSGGPDEYGYTWKDSNDPEGPTFDFIDISMTGTEITGLADDNSVDFIDMGMDFEFYWLTFDRLKVGSNGWLSFNNVNNIAHCFPTLPLPGSGDNLICPLMADISFAENGNPGRMYYLHDEMNNRFIISYHNVPFWVNAVPAYSGDNTFQVILDGNDNSITFNYLSMDDALASTGPCAGVEANSVVGIENVTGTIGLKIYGDAVLPTDTYTIRFEYPEVVTFQILDASPSWNNNEANGGIFIMPNNDETISVNVSNTGNTDLESFQVDAGMRKPPIPADLWSSTATVPPLAVGESATVTFDTPFNSDVAFGGSGQYTLTTTTNLPVDLVAGNDENRSEVVVIDNSDPTELVLSYSTGGAPDGAASWSGGGGNSGMGVYFEPPFYPFTITAIEMWTNPDPNGAADDGYTIEIRDDNAAPGEGTLMGLESIDGGSYMAQWNRTELSFPITIDAGGFYVAWVMQGNSMSIGTEGAGAISRRSFEIISNSWAGYRSNDVSEILMRVIAENTVNTENAEYSNSISIFPNPTSDVLTIDSDLSDESIEQVQLFNTLGELISNEKVNITPGTQHNLDLSNLATGIYYLNLFINDEQVTRKVSVLK